MEQDYTQQVHAIGIIQVMVVAHTNGNQRICIALQVSLGLPFRE